MTTFLENTADVPPGDPGPDVPDTTRGLSQGRLVLKRFLGHRAAIVSLVFLVFIIVLAISSIGIGPIHGLVEVLLHGHPADRERRAADAAAVPLQPR